MPARRGNQYAVRARTRLRRRLSRFSRVRRYGVKTALRNAAGSVLAGRSLTCPSPSSTTRQVPSARRARSAATNGEPSEPISGVKGSRSMSGGRSPGVSGCAVTRRQVPPAYQVRASADVNFSNRRSTKPPVSSSSRSSRNLARSWPASLAAAASGAKCSSARRGRSGSAGTRSSTTPVCAIAGSDRAPTTKRGGVHRPLRAPNAEYEPRWLGLSATTPSHICSILCVFDRLVDVIFGMSDDPWILCGLCKAYSWNALGGQWRGAGEGGYSAGR